MFLRKLFDNRFSYKDCNFSRGCLITRQDGFQNRDKYFQQVLILMFFSKTVTRSIEGQFLSHTPINFASLTEGLNGVVAFTVIG